MGQQENNQNTEEATNQEEQEEQNNSLNPSELEDKLNSRIDTLETKIEKLLNTVSEQNTSNSQPKSQSRSTNKSKSKQEDTSQSESQENSNLSLKKLQTELENLREELSEKEQQNLEQQRNAKIKDLFAREGIQYIDSATNLFLSENQNKMKVENNQWFVEDGEKVFDLDDYVSQFMERPEIKSFKAPKTKGGNMKPPEKTYPADKSNAKKSSLKDSILVEE